jgi:hypothetical protein
MSLEVFCFTQFVTGGDLPEPAECGLDPTGDGLGCCFHAPCTPST